MKISNETKIGILAIVAIAFLVLGFNFLKGKNLFDKNDKLYAVFPKVTGLLNSNAVYLNGLQVGRVYDIKERTKNINDGIVVTINLSRDVNIPANSVTYISADIMGTASMIIEPGNAGQYLQDGDTINTVITHGLNAVHALIGWAMKHPALAIQGVCIHLRCARLCECFQRCRQRRSVWVRRALISPGPARSPHCAAS